MGEKAEKPVTRWLEQIAAGDSNAAAQVWELYSQYVEEASVRALNGAKKRTFDEEDVAIAVLNSLFLGLQSGKIRKIENRWHLMGLLKEMARRKSAEAQRKQMAARRGKGKVKGDSGFDGLDQRLGSHGINGVPDRAPNPAEAFARAEAFANLLGELKTNELREVAKLRIAGFSNAEIAERLGVVERTVDRRVAEIKSTFSAVIDSRND